ncbi:hypothetical protein CBL_03994 [Carabus blaptoides fortunei]
MGWAASYPGGDRAEHAEQDADRLRKISRQEERNKRGKEYKTANKKNLTTISVDTDDEQVAANKGKEEWGTFPNSKWWNAAALRGSEAASNSISFDDRLNTRQDETNSDRKCNEFWASERDTPSNSMAHSLMAVACYTHSERVTISNHQRTPRHKLIHQQRRSEVLRGTSPQGRQPYPRG